MYAGFLEHTDHHVGRLIDAIDDLGALDDTIIYYIVGDNGASGALNGAFNEMANFNGMAALETPGSCSSKMNELGTPSSYNALRGGLGMGDGHALPVDQAGGLTQGTRNSTIVHWPKGIEEPGGLRSQFTHVIDVAPTILEAAGLPEPAMVNGVQPVTYGGHLHAVHLQRRDESGAPRPAVLRDVRQPRYLPPGLERGDEAPHSVAHGRWRPAPFDEDVWELYDGSSDYSQARNLVADNREMLARLQRLLADRGPPSTTCSRWTTAPPSGWSRRRPADRP